MSHYWIFFLGMVVGTFVGLIIAGLLGAAAHGDHYADLDGAYQAGMQAERHRYNMAAQAEIKRGKMGL